MTFRTIGAACMAATFLLCSTPAMARAPAEADTPSNTPAGAVFTLPKAWSLERTPTMVVASAPENDTRLVFIDLPTAKDGGEAAVAAWALYRPGLAPKVKIMTPDKATSGWDEVQVVYYDTPPNDQTLLRVLAYRKGQAWTVLIVDAKLGTLSKRSAAVGLLADSVRPAGYSRETFAGRKPAPLDAARIAELKSFMETSMKELGIPGASVAIVDHGKLVFIGGFGVKELAKPDPVDADTLFMIASNTKGMSTLLLAELVDEGKLAWDQPVTQVYPGFRLGSAETTSKVLVKHLVCACTGLPRKDMDWIFNTRDDTPASTTFDQLARTEPTSGFGEVYQYNNLMASAAGYVGGHLVHPDRELGAAYDAAMQEKIFGPLGMKDTTFDMARALAGNHASPHGDDIDGHPALSSMDFNTSVVPYRPAGGAWSSARDMIKYVELELALGKLPNGRRLVSEQSLLARRARGVSSGEDEYYGMGLEEDVSTGVSVIHHGGSMVGYKSDILFIPEAQIGAVILTNADNGRPLLDAFRRRLLELVYDGKPEAAAAVSTTAAADRAWVAKERPTLSLPPTAAQTAGLADVYVNADLGAVTVHRSPTAVVFDFGQWRSSIASKVNDDGTVSLLTADPGVIGFEFVAGIKDGKRTLVLRDGQHEYVYVER